MYEILSRPKPQTEFKIKNLRGKSYKKRKGISSTGFLELLLALILLIVQAILSFASDEKKNLKIVMYRYAIEKQL